jgi:hypothetical protein
MRTRRHAVEEFRQRMRDEVARERGGAEPEPAPSLPLVTQGARSPRPRPAPASIDEMIREVAFAGRISDRRGGWTRLE